MNDEEERIVALVISDLAATIDLGMEAMVVAEASQARLVATTLPDFERRVVESVQQRLHDEHLDTTWPTCPEHSNHPLWYSDGWWRCAKLGAVARLGEIASVRQAGR